MMVPMMLPADGSAPYGAATSMAMMNPFMMPQPYMMPQMAQPPAPGQQQVQQTSLPQSQFSNYAMAPQAQQQSQTPSSSVSHPTGAQSSSSNHVGASVSQPQGSSSQPQFSQSTLPVPIMPAGGFSAGSATMSSTPHFPAIAPNPMSFFMPPQSFMTGNPMQMMAPSVTASTTLATSGDSSNMTDSQTNSTANNGDSKSPPAGQQGVQGGSNLAHCA